MDDMEYVVSPQRNHIDMQKDPGWCHRVPKITETSTKTKKNHKSLKEQISMQLVQKIRSYQRTLPLEPKKPEQLVEGKKGGSCEWSVYLIKKI